MDIPKAIQRYTLAAQPLDSGSVQLNGRVLELQTDDTLPSMNGMKVPAGKMVLAPHSITFIGIPEAGNEACHQ
jgi:hypothetical protein